MTKNTHSDLKSDLLVAILPHVAFDGWTEAAFCAACDDSGIDQKLARLTCNQGALDLAGWFHVMGDQKMISALKERDMSDMRFRDKIALAVRLRLDSVEDKEAVRRGATLFALPHNARLGAGLIWGTADAIWTALGDTSLDVNWYTKRASLSTVYSTTILYWLGDESPENAATWAFLDRRIENVMQFEKIKSQLRANKGLQNLMRGPNWVLSKIKAPTSNSLNDMPGFWGQS
tara:strand:- start:803 stop:1498 length:696 start_codon:yes stop_codon:yes gene_type:complete